MFVFPTARRLIMRATDRSFCSRAGEIEHLRHGSNCEVIFAWSLSSDVAVPRLLHVPLQPVQHLPLALRLPGRDFQIHVPEAARGSQA
jgi:hypothetical protein